MIDWLDRARAAHRRRAAWCAWSRARTGTPRSSARRSTACPAIRCSRARCTPTSPISPARRRCSRRPTRSTRSSRRTTRSRSRRSTRSRGDADYEFQCLHGMGETLYDQVVGDGSWSQPCLPHLRAGRLARDAARLSRAPAARERRQHVVRQPHRRSGGAHRVADRRSGRASRRRPAARRIAQSAVAGSDLLPGAAQFAAASISPTTPVLRARGAQLAAAPPRRRSGADARAAQSSGAAPSTIVNPADHGDVVGTVVTTRRRRRRAQPSRPRVDARRGVVDDAAAERAGMPRARGRSARGARARRSSRSPCARRARHSPTPSPKCAKRSTSCATTRRRRARLGGAAAASGRSSRSRRGIFRWRSSPGRSRAALAAGNPVLAKPAEQTPLIAHEAVRAAARGRRAARRRCSSCPATARRSARRWSPIRAIAGVRLHRLDRRRARDQSRSSRARDDDPVLIAETGGQNAMIVDSSALPEQVVADALASAFDSAGQRCSALRVLCLQDDVAEHVLAMLEGAMRELVVGDPAAARDRCRSGDRRRRAGVDARATSRACATRGRRCSSCRCPRECARGTFVAPTLIELPSLDALARSRAKCSVRCCTSCA